MKEALAACGVYRQHGGMAWHARARWRAWRRGARNGSLGVIKWRNHQQRIFYRGAAAARMALQSWRGGSINRAGAKKVDMEGRAMKAFLSLPWAEGGGALVGGWEKMKAISPGEKGEDH